MQKRVDRIENKEYTEKRLEDDAGMVSHIKTLENRVKIQASAFDSGNYWMV